MPTTPLPMFHTPQLGGVAPDVEDTIAKITDQAAGATFRPQGQGRALPVLTVTSTLGTFLDQLKQSRNRYSEGW